MTHLISLSIILWTDTFSIISCLEVGYFCLVCSWLSEQHLKETVNLSGKALPVQTSQSCHRPTSHKLDLLIVECSRTRGHRGWNRSRCRTLAPWVGGPDGNGPIATCPPCGSCTPVVSSLQGGGWRSHSPTKALWFELGSAAFPMCVSTLVARGNKLNEHTCKTFLNSAYFLPAVNWGSCERTGCGPGLFQLECRPTVVVCTKVSRTTMYRLVGTLGYFVFTRFVSLSPWLQTQKLRPLVMIVMSSLSSVWVL